MELVKKIRSCQILTLRERTRGGSNPPTDTTVKERKVPCVLVFLFFLCSPFSLSDHSLYILFSQLPQNFHPRSLNFRFFYSRIVHMDHETGESLDSMHSDNMTCEHGDFECNICFEIAQDPIVTLCGHLYCWPCLCEWLQIHSHSHECPVCKALIEDQKLVPIYGRGKASSDPRSHVRPRMNIPNRPVFGPRPQTASALDMNYFQPNELDPTGGFMPMASARVGNLTLSALFGAIPAFFNLHVQGFRDATVYGATTGVPYLFSGSVHGGYAHGFHHSIHVDGTKFFIKMFLLIVGFLLVVSLIL